MTSDQPNQPSPATTRGLVGYHEWLAEEIFAFQREAYPRRRVDWIEPRWRWMFLESARRLDVSPMVWVYRAKTGVAAHQGAIAVRVQIDGTEQITGWFVETMVLEAFRGKAVGPMLVAKAKADLPFNLSLGQTPQMRELQFSLGWRQVAPLPTYVYVLNGRAVVRGKLPGGPPAWLGGLGLTVLQWLRSRGARRPAPGLLVRQVSRFDGSHDDLWASLRPHFRCATIRDSSYLNWKYCDQPGQSFERYELLERGRPVAVVVFRMLEADAAYRYRRASVVELVLPPDRPAIVNRALRTLCDRARSKGVDLVVMDLLHPVLESLVRRFGFAARERYPGFLALC